MISLVKKITRIRYFGSFLKGSYFIHGFCKSKPLIKKLIGAKSTTPLFEKQQQNLRKQPLF
jgi:hypothetical protein